jgi:DNA-binding NarL/FixJ family response regulator
MMNAISVLLVEDHQIVRQGLRLLIDAQPNLNVVGEASNGRDAIVAILESNPDVVVFDISMPEMNGIEMVKELRRSNNHSRLLALTANSDSAYLAALIQLGISGYLLKRSAASDLVEAIQKVASNGNFLDASIVRELGEGVFSPTTFSATTVGTAISAREEEVIQLIARGLSNKEVAAQLAISVKTVETHKSRAMAKLQLHSRSELLRFAVANRWLEYGE